MTDEAAADSALDACARETAWETWRRENEDDFGTSVNYAAHEGFRAGWDCASVHVIAEIQRAARERFDLLKPGDYSPSAQTLADILLIVADLTGSTP